MFRTARTDGNSRAVSDAARSRTCGRRDCPVGNIAVAASFATLSEGSAAARARAHARRGAHMNDYGNRMSHARRQAATDATAGDAGRLERQIDEERIARRAYQIYESRDRADGHADADWLQAEAEYAARQEGQRSSIEPYGAGGSFADRVRNARR
jgi:hypothetical protein